MLSKACAHAGCIAEEEAVFTAPPDDLVRGESVFRMVTEQEVGNARNDLPVQVPEISGESLTQCGCFAPSRTIVVR